MRAAIHRNDIREAIVRPYAGDIVGAFILMQDNERDHAARMSLTCLDYEGVMQCDHLANQFCRPQPNRTYLGHSFYF